MRNKKLRDLTFCSILAAIIIVMVVANIGYIPFFGVANITILTIPVLVGAIFLGKWYGLALGVIFGLTSMIRAFILPIENTNLNAPFNNPLLSVLPRAFLGYIIAPIYKKFCDIFQKNKKGNLLSIVITVAICQLIHSVSVIVIMYYVCKNGFYFFSSDYSFIPDSGVLTFLLTIFGINGLLELLAAVIIVPSICIALNHVVNKSNNKYSEEREDDSEVVESEDK